VLLPFATHRIQLAGKLILFELGDLVCDSVTADSHVTMLKQQGFNERPNLWKTSMLAEDVLSRIYQSPHADNGDKAL